VTPAAKRAESRLAAALSGSGADRLVDALANLVQGFPQAR
jgi:hypothetical protein